MTLLGWSKTLAAEVGRNGVTVNLVIPGRIATERIAFLDRKRAEREGKTLEQVEAESVGSIAVGRYGQVQEYGDAVAFLASGNASFITGSVLRVDGGMVPSV
jgi:3-oxoacyl-[acyl-carrier protein] reductase